MYSNNHEYRNLLRTYFKMDIDELEKQWAHLKDEDPESYDEFLYDTSAMERGMDMIFEKTKENPLFMKLYRLAAGCFLSEDEQTGLCVLLTYDYFADFICLYENPNPVLDDFAKLYKRLS